MELKVIFQEIKLFDKQRSIMHLQTLPPSTRHDTFYKCPPLLNKQISISQMTFYVLKFMSSNRLVANASKATLIFINNKTQNEIPTQIKVGKAVMTQEKHAELLGLTIDDNQEWKTHIYGKGGLIPSLNSRLFMIKRLRNEMNMESAKKMADSFYTS